MVNDLFRETVPESELEFHDLMRKQFVERELSDMVLSMTDGKVYSCKYLKSIYGGVEAVFLEMRGHDGRRLELRADISNCTKTMIASAVIRAIGWQL